MTTLDELLDSDNAQRRATTAGWDAVELLRSGLFWVGWALAKAVFLALAVVGGFFWALGWTARRLIWPALAWIAAAVRVGWDDGRRRSP